MATATTGATCADLTAFQRDLMAVLARDGPEYGLGLRDQLETIRTESINNARLYTNLDDLDEMGFVERSARDRRTNEYALTTDGKATLDVYQDWLANCLEDQA